MFKKLFSSKKSSKLEKSPDVQAVQQPVMPPPTLDELGKFVVEAEAAFMVLKSQRTPDGTVDGQGEKERQALMVLQTALMKALDEHGRTVLNTPAYSYILQAMFQFCWEALAWCGVWDEMEDEFYEGYFSRVSESMKWALYVEAPDSTRLVDLATCDIGVAPKRLDDAERVHISRALINVYSAYIAFRRSNNSEPEPPTLRLYWGWLAQEDEGGWRARYTIVEKDDYLWHFRTKNGGGDYYHNWVEGFHRLVQRDRGPN